MAADFYQTGKGWDSQQTQAQLWQDPRWIPGQSSTLKEVQQQFQEWLKQQVHVHPYRGFTTINKLGLNRNSLVRARAAHLRHMRAILLSAGSKEKETARKIILKIQKNDADSILITPQYLSATLDALQTWQANKLDVNYLETYTTILADFEKTLPQILADDTPVYNDSLMFGVPAGQEKNTSQRLIIYLSSSDAMYGADEGFKGWLLAIDWQEYLDYDVVITNVSSGVKAAETTTLRALAETNPRSLWRKFKDSQVVIKGEFPSLEGQ